MRTSGFEYAIVLDFEATCEDGGAPSPQEIIEFPSVLVALDDLRTLDDFSSFVRPHHHPELSEFCTDLTSITQQQVDEAPSFPEVFATYDAWLDEHGVHAENALFVTCGDWDLYTMLPEQCRAAEPMIEYIRPIWTRWLNIKRMFAEVTHVRRGRGMAKMLDHLDIELEGHHHRGIDDCRNITKLLKTLLRRGGTFAPTKHLKPTRHPPVHLCLVRGDDSERMLLPHRDIGALRGLARDVFGVRLTSFVRKSTGEEITQEAMTDLRPEEIIFVAVESSGE